MEFHSSSNLNEIITIHIIIQGEVDLPDFRSGEAFCYRMTKFADLFFYFQICILSFNVNQD